MAFCVFIMLKHSVKIFFTLWLKGDLTLWLRVSPEGAHRPQYTKRQIYVIDYYNGEIKLMTVKHFN